jgi:integration host factor subunit alpha
VQGLVVVVEIPACRRYKAQSREIRMIKADITTQLHEKLGFSNRESSNIVDQFFDIVKSSLMNGINVKISGLGNFIVRKKKARKGRNPQTGDETEIVPRTVLVFQHGQVLKEQMNDRRK